MKNISLFKNIDEKAKKRILNQLQARTIQFQKDQIILSYLNNTDYIGIINQGEANLIRYDYNGKRTIIEHLNADQIFGSLFIEKENSELNIIAATFCEITLFEYQTLLEFVKKGNISSIVMLQNLTEILSQKLFQLNQRMEVLTQRSIREKLLTYFEQMNKNKNNKTFNLPFSYTNLADYLSIDRSAMMREIKHLKDEGFIKEVNKKITILSS